MTIYCLHRLLPFFLLTCTLGPAFSQSGITEEPVMENGMDILRYRYKLQNEKIERYEKTMNEQVKQIIELKELINSNLNQKVEKPTFEEEYKKTKTLSAPLLSIAERLTAAGNGKEADELYQTIIDYFPYSFEAHIAKTKLAEKKKPVKKK